MRKKTGLLIGVAACLLGLTGYLVYANWEALTGGKRIPLGAATGHQIIVHASPLQLRNNILIRELMRQALFLAERDELGQPTRDATLGENPAEAPQGVRGVIAHAFLRDDGVHVQLFRDAAMAADGEPVPEVHPVPATAGRPMLFETLIPNVNGDQVDYLGLVERAEGFSRGEFKRQLGAASANAGATTGPAAMPAAEIERRLGEMNFVSQFAAVRAAHRVVGQPGAAERATGALVRGYANLGQLTSFQWTAATKAFQARSLLYAQRMVVGAAPGSPALATALRHRAYALALAGLQGNALADLDQADQLAPFAADAARPGWVAVLPPYCRYEPGRLAEVAAGHPADAPLATFLCFLTVERARSQSVTNGYGEVALTASPDCVRVIDAMSAVSGVSANHVLTEGAPAVFAQSLARRLPAIAELPAGVRGAVDAAVKAEFAPSATAAIPAALMAAGRDDAGEPSWGVLGRLIEETNFVHLRRRAAFMAEAWGVDASQFVAETRPLYRGHPYAAFIECYGMGRGTTITEWGNKLDAAARQLARRQPTFSVDPMFDKFREAGTIVPGGEPSFANWQDRFADFTSGDLERYLTERRPQGNSLRYLTDALRRASPHSPTCIASRIEYFWDESRPQVDTWKREHGDHPVVAAALAVKYSKLKDWAEAEKFLRLYIDKAPDQWAYQMLADNYLAQGDEANWLATLKARLEKPDYSLDHAWTNNTIARHYMGQRKWTTARPYAEAAAQSYARWALETVAECYDGLGERERASAVRAAIAERYGR